MRVLAIEQTWGIPRGPQYKHEICLPPHVKFQSEAAPAPHGAPRDSPTVEDGDGEGADVDVDVSPREIHSRKSELPPR